jgi:hypothetical protein
MCQIYVVIYYTVQGASLFSLTMVTLNRATMLFLPSKVEKVRSLSYDVRLWLFTF